MTDYLTLTEFIPGTKAKAEEVNANFATLKDAVNSKAAKEGDSTQTFEVATATANTHAVTKLQLDTLEDDLTEKIDGTSARFCVKSGNTTSGNGDLLSYSGMNVTLKVGGSYTNLVISNYKGELSTITSIATINMTGKTSGTYNIFLTSAGTAYTLANTIYKQPSRPTMNDGDVWLNTSKEPISAIKYTSNSDVEFNDVPIGKIIIASGAITSVETFPFNQNGYNITMQTQSYRFPDEKRVTSKSFSTTYTADSDGWISVYGHSNGIGQYLALNVYDTDGTTVLYGDCIFSPNGDASSYIFRPIKKGKKYLSTTNYGGSGSYIKFFPAEGAN